MLGFEEVEKYDPELAQAMSDELTRQRTHIELIASENLVSKAVMAAMGSVLTNKYAEGYPGKRYYGGCEYVDVVEESPIPYAHVTTTTTHKTLRGPRGGMIMCSNEVNKKYNFNKAIFPGIQGGPLMHVIAGKAVCFKEALDPAFKLYAQGIIDNAQALASGLMNRGFELVSGGTDNHLMLVNLINKGVTGKQAEKMLDAANITCNKNTVPNDPQSAFTTSGIRLGTAAVTTRGFNTADMDVVAQAISLVIDDMEKNKEEAMALVKSLTDKYPLYE